MREITPLIDILGEENVKKVKDSMADLIIERFRQDLEDYDRYLIYPPDMLDNVNDAVDSTSKKITKMYKEAVIDINQQYINDVKAMMLSRHRDVDLRKQIIELVNRYRYMGNEHSKEYKFAKELEDILRDTQYSTLEEI